MFGDLGRHGHGHRGHRGGGGGRTVYINSGFPSYPYGYNPYNIDPIPTTATSVIQEPIDRTSQVLKKVLTAIQNDPKLSDAEKVKLSQQLLNNL